MPTRAREYRTTYHRTKAQDRRSQNPGAWILHTRGHFVSQSGTVLGRGGVAAGRVKYPSCRRGGAPAALTSRAGCSHGGATRTAPRPPSRFRRAPTRLFSVPKIQDSDPASQSQRTCRPPPVTLPHTATPLFLLRSLTDEPATTSADVNIEQIDRSLI